MLSHFFSLSWRVKFPFESPADIRDIRNARYSTEFSVVHDFTSMVEHICTRGSHSFCSFLFSSFFLSSFFFLPFFFSKRHKCGQALVAAVSWRSVFFPGRVQKENRIESTSVRRNSSRSIVVSVGAIQRMRANAYQRCTTIPKRKKEKGSWKEREKSWKGKSIGILWLKRGR